MLGLSETQFCRDLSPLGPSYWKISIWLRQCSEEVFGPESIENGPTLSGGSGVASSEGRAVAVAGADAHHRFHRADEDLAVTDFTGAGGISY